MIKELYTEFVRETTLNVTFGEIDSVRKKSIKKSGCRVYKDGFIGVAGTLGEATESTWKMAEENLDAKVAYPYEPEKNRKRIRDLRKSEMTPAEFIKMCEDILTQLRNDYPGLIFSQKMMMVESEVILQNDAGLDLRNYDRSFIISLIYKASDSVSIMDSFISWQNRLPDKEDFFRSVRPALDAQSKTVPLITGDKITVVTMMPGSPLIEKLESELSGEKIGRGSSLFSGHIGDTLFSEKLTVFQDTTEEREHCAFFDNEGVSNPDDKVTFIENGKILRPFTDKKNAAAFSMPLTGTSGGSYDSVPTIGSPTLEITPCEKTLGELIGGEKAIIVIQAGGGDYTNVGDFASPVQSALLVEDGRIIGKLPEFNIMGNLYEMFGEDFIGVSSDKPLFSSRALAVKMKVSE